MTEYIIDSGKETADSYEKWLLDNTDATDRAKLIKRADFTEQHNFILEAAMQTGFKVVNDNATLYQVSDEWIVEFAARVAGAAIEQVAGIK